MDYFDSLLAQTPLTLDPSPLRGEGTADAKELNIRYA